MRDQEQDVLTVLNEFFVSTDAGFVSPRADKEIQHYHSKVEQASKAGKASAERRSNTRSTDVQPTINHKPITINQEPKKEKIAVAPSVWPEWIPLEAWYAFLEMRKNIKKPPTEKAVELLLAKLKKFKDAGQDVQAILEKSITNNWQDVYEIKEGKFGFVKPLSPAEQATNRILGRPADSRLPTPEEQAERAKRIATR